MCNIYLGLEIGRCSDLWRGHRALGSVVQVPLQGEAQLLLEGRICNATGHGLHAQPKWQSPFVSTPLLINNANSDVPAPFL